jgi:thioredoxin reductase (NADPH)
VIFDPTIALYGSIMAVIWGIYTYRHRRVEQKSLAIKAAAVEAGLTEPASLHPSIDPSLCLGCGNCTKVCPEGDILGIIRGKVELVEPTHCIGHGACAAACPTGAITLVFGTAKRGIDLPRVGPDFQTNVPGIFIAGELGGMGLIRNAVTQGRQAVDSIRKMGDLGQPGQLDLVIVGAGPAGLAGALAAKSHGLRYTVIEQDDLGGTVFKYPRGKIVMTAPAVLPIVGQVNFRETTKESLLSFWKDIETKYQLNVRYREQVVSIESTGRGFAVTTNAGTERATAILLAIGRRGTPRKLDVPGEDLPKVVYQLIDAEQYKGHHVLVVGGGDSALEAAGTIAEQPGTTVTLSYRSEAFSRAKLKNRERVDRMSKTGEMQVLLSSKVRSITADAVDIEWNGELHRFRNDAVIICAGGILPTEFLKSAGIEMETKYGTV